MPKISKLSNKKKITKIKKTKPSAKKSAPIAKKVTVDKKKT